MKWIQAAGLLALVVLMAVVWMFYLKIAALEERMKDVQQSSDIDQRFEALEMSQFEMKNQMNLALSGVIDRIDTLESGMVERKPRGPVTADYLLTDLVRQIHLKKDAGMMPDEERRAQDRIDAIIQELGSFQQQGEDIISALIEQVRVRRDPEVQIVLIRDVVWRLGPDAGEALMGLFRDRDFTSNLRVLAAASAIKAARDKKAMLDEFTTHLADPKEGLVIKTGLVRHVFREHRFEGAVELLIVGAKTQQYHDAHRIECLRALSTYDDSRVYRALEEIIDRGEEMVLIINLAIDAYHRLMREESVPFFEKILKEEKIDPVNRSKIQSILKKYEDGKEGG